MISSTSITSFSSTESQAGSRRVSRQFPGQRVVGKTACPANCQVTLCRDAHPFLHYDSFINCTQSHFLTADVIEQQLMNDRQRLKGYITPEEQRAIVCAVESGKTIEKQISCPMIQPLLNQHGILLKASDIARLNENGIRRYLTPVAPAILHKIQQGAIASKFTPTKLKRLLQVMTESGESH